MEMATTRSIERDIAGALGWWREAGVDCDFADEAAVWLAEAPPPEPERQAAATAPLRQTAAPVAAPSPNQIGGDKACWPQDLAAFQAWWCSEPTLDESRSGSPVPPRGVAGAAVMVLVEQPEAADADSLLSGDQGTLLAAMLAAMGIPAEQTYFASVLPRHTPLPDWQALQAAGIGAVLAHHIALAAPQRLITFGRSIPPLLGHDPAQSAQYLQSFNHEGRTIPVLASNSLGALTRGAAKAGFWQRWLNWTKAQAA